MLKILAATGNKHKLLEFRSMIQHPEIEILGLEDVNEMPEVIEDGATFEENAAKKALAASDGAFMPAFADDSGLEVEALNGEPGVRSARYAGEGASNEQRIAKLLKAMENCENRAAKFTCVIAVANEGEVLGTFEGEVRGTITREVRGENGFGYDPVFIPDGYEQTFGELASEIKDKISHRANAIQSAVEFFEEAMSIDI